MFLCLASLPQTMSFRATHVPAGGRRITVRVCWSHVFLRPSAGGRPAGPHGPSFVSPSSRNMDVQLHLHSLLSLLLGKYPEVESLYHREVLFPAF